MVTRTEATDFLAHHGWLTLTPPGFCKTVLAKTQLREFNKGETVYRIDDPPGGLWASSRVRLRSSSRRREPPRISRIS
jgi:hypothetical protein